MTDAFPDLSLAPGCFGLAMTYRDDARECGACPFASACAPLAAENLAILRAELGIKEPAPKPAKPAKPISKVAIAATLANPAIPKKVLTQLDRAERNGIVIMAALARGENPFKGKKPAFLNIACHLLLRIKAGISREVLVQCFEQKLGHSHLTAVSHAKQAVQVLEAVGAAQELNGLITLKVLECTAS